MTIDAKINEYSRWSCTCENQNACRISSLICSPIMEISSPEYSSTCQPTISPRKAMLIPYQPPKRRHMALWDGDTYKENRDKKNRATKWGSTGGQTKGKPTIKHGLKNRFLSMIFHRYIRYRTTPIGYWTSIIEREEYRKNIEKIIEISSIFRFRTDKLTKKIEREVTREAVEEAYQNIGNISTNISDISLIYLKISEIFLKTFF